MSTPMHETASLIRAYVADLLTGYGEDEPPAAILAAVKEAQTADEVCHLGRALLCRHQSLSDPPYRLGGAMCDRRLADIATRLDWTA